MATVLVVDPHPASRAGLVAWLSVGLHTVVAAGSVPDQLPRGSVAVVAVHAARGLEDVSRIGLSAPDLPVVAVLPEVSRVGFVAALCAGAAGIATWDTSPDLMTAIVDAALSGLAMLPSDFVRVLAQGHRPQETLISEAEIAWLGSLAAGLSVADVAAAAGYPERSMYRLLRKTYGALGVDSRSEAIVEALRLGLL